MVVKLSDFLSTSFSTFSANDTNNTGVTYPGAVVHTTTLTPGVGIGAGIDFQVETADNNTETGMRLEAVTTDVTAGSEDFDLVVKLMQNGAAANEKFRVTSTGVISTTTLNAASHTVGAFFTANSTLVNAAAINITGQVNTATLYAATSANIGSAVIAANLAIGAPIQTDTRVFVNTSWTSDTSTYNVYLYGRDENTALTAIRNRYGIFSELNNRSQNKNADGVTVYNSNYRAVVGDAVSGSSTSGGNAFASELIGGNFRSYNYANGSGANSVNAGIGSRNQYFSYGSGVTSTATGTQHQVFSYGTGIITTAIGSSSYIAIGNTTATGNITTAYAAYSQIESNTAATIGTGYLFYGQHTGTTTTNKFGIYISGESNNYFSSNVSVAGALRVGANVLANTSTLFVGNSTVYATHDNGGLYVEEVGVNYSTLSPDQLLLDSTGGGQGQYTSTTLSLVGLGASPNGAYLNPASLQVGNSSIFANYTAANLSIYNGANIANLSPTSLTMSNFLAVNSLGIWHFGTTGVVNAGAHTIGTTFIANTLGVYHTGTVNAASHTVGTSTIANSIGVYTGTVNAASHTVGTSTIANSIGVYTGIVNAASHTVGTSFTANSTVVNAVAYYAGTLLVGNTTVVNATHLSGTAGSGYQTTAGLSANVATLTSNNATNLGGVAAAAYLSNTANKTISGGFAVTAYPLTASTSFTVNPLLGNYQYITNNGAFTITAPASDCAVDIMILNGATAGSVTFTGGAGGFQVGATTGAVMNTINGNEYIVSIRRINGLSTYSIYAMQ